MPTLVLVPIQIIETEHDGDPLPPTTTHEVTRTADACQMQQVQMISYMSRMVNGYRSGSGNGIVNRDECYYWQNVSGGSCVCV